MINGNTVVDSQAVWRELNKCKKSGRKYEVWFVKDEQSIRADQAKADQERAKRQQADEERRRKEESEKKLQADAKKKREDDLNARKQEYWDRQNEKTEPVPEAA